MVLIITTNDKNSNYNNFSGFSKQLLRYTKIPKQYESFMIY